MGGKKIVAREVVVMWEKGHFVYAYLTFGVRVIVYVSY
jgi:hypothetical protein